MIVEMEEGTEGCFQCWAFALEVTSYKVALIHRNTVMIKIIVQVSASGSSEGMNMFSEFFMLIIIGTLLP